MGSKSERQARILDSQQEALEALSRVVVNLYADGLESAANDVACAHLELARKFAKWREGTQ